MQAQAQLSHIRTEIRRVIPRYETTTARYLAYIVGLCGVVKVAVGGAGLAIHSYPAIGATNIVSGVGALVAAVLGLLSVRQFKKEVWAITGYMAAAVCSAIFSITLLGLSVYSLDQEPGRTTQMEGQILVERQALDITSAVVSALSAVMCSAAGVVCCQALYYGCCKRRTGVTYVSEQGASGSQTVTMATEEGNGMPFHLTTDRGDDIHAIEPHSHSPGGEDGLKGATSANGSSASIVRSPVVLEIRLDS